MRNFVLAILLVLIGPLKAEVNMGWEAISSPGVEHMKKSTVYDETFISKLRKDDDYNLTTFSEDDYIKSLPGIRKMIHILLDITQYKITDHSISKMPDEVNIKIKGTYLKQNKEISFCEHHVFNYKYFIQKQFLYLTANESKMFNDKSNCNQILERDI